MKALLRNQLLAHMWHRQREVEAIHNYWIEACQTGPVELIQTVTHGLIQHLLILGHHAKAREFAISDGHAAMIDQHEHAILRDDEERCGCQHVPRIERLLQHQVVNISWSEKHDGIVKHYQCECGDTNALPHPPHPHHGLIERERARNEHLYRQAQAIGWKPHMGVPVIGGATPKSDIDLLHLLSA